MAEWLEAGMVICFGASWPVSILKSYRAGTARGKSLVFLLLITLGYVCGIASKVIGGRISYVVVFYCINLCMLIIELLLYARNRRRDLAREQTN